MIARLTLLLVAGLVLGCTDKPPATSITFWHFWSEPAQEQALLELLHTYEATHPGITVEPVPLSWADGKQKLQLAFNAGTQPDIVHLGMDWFAEFDASGVFAPLEHPNTIADRAALWVLNARALVHWTGAPARHRWGLARSDAHNILKRSLPLLWQAGATEFYTRTPIAADMNDQLVQALWALRDTIRQGALLEPSRSLDERFLRGEIEYLYTGAWIIDMANARNVTSFEVLPTPSILNGDVLCISKGSRLSRQAADLIAWLTEYRQSAQFCHQVSDAGFPASDLVFSDAEFQLDNIQRGFLLTAKESRPLPASPVLLRIEPIIEDLIERCYAAASRREMAELVESARVQVQSIEQSQD